MRAEEKRDKKIVSESVPKNVESPQNNQHKKTNEIPEDVLKKILE